MLICECVLVFILGVVGSVFGWVDLFFDCVRVCDTKGQAKESDKRKVSSPNLPVGNKELLEILRDN